MRFAGHAAEMLGATNVVRPPVVWQSIDQIIESIRTEIGSDRFAAAWHDGLTMSTAAAIDLALNL